MAYKMRFRLLIRGVTTPGTASATDPLLFAIGDLITDTVNPTGGAGTTGSPFTFADPTGPVLTTEAGASSAGISVCNKLQSSLKYNVRAEVWGAPVGHVETGNTDLTDDEKAEKLYVQIDTPSPGLLFAIHRANRKPRSVGEAAFVVPYFGPEVGVAETAEPTP